MLSVWIVLALLPILGGAERFNCRGRILGAYYADAKSGCKAFHVCVRVAGGGVRDFRFFCPPGTLFHQEAQTCTDWGDDDPLACPADLYDGQFDLYKIGSGFDTKKASSPGNREEEAEFGLQRAETGDRRLNNAPASDLRAAHSSDFFSGQRDRGRDDAPPPSPSSSRQSFRRVPTTRSPPSTQFINTPSLSPPSHPPHYEQKRKLVRKRPIYTKSPNYAQNSAPQKSSPQPNYPQEFIQKQAYSQAPVQQQSTPQHFQQSTPQQPYQKPPTLQQNFQSQPSSQQTYQNQPTQEQPKSKPASPQQRPAPQQAFRQETTPQSFPVPTQQSFNQRNHVQHRVTAPPPPAIVPAQYKDEYVEVSRVTPKKSRYFASPTTAQYSPSTVAPNFNKKDGLVELYNYESQSTPGISAQKDNRPFKVKNSFSVADIPLQRDQDFARTNINIQPNGASRASPTTLDYNTASSQSYSATTPAYKNFNSVSYDSDKNFGVSSSKQNYYNSPSTTNAYTTQRPVPPPNLNTVAYNTNNGFNNIKSANYVGNDDDEDDGQYRPPHGEDDGQYRPELYERELLSGAHSLNIAASGNRLPEDQKQSKSRDYQNQKPVGQTAAPRPFRPAPTQSAAPVATESAPTTYRANQGSTRVTFDYYQTYTTTSRPEAPPAPPQVSASAPTRPAPSAPPARQSPTAPPAPSSKPPPPRPPQAPLAHPVNNKDDASYDYAYYDSDPGISEYDQIQEFGKTKKA